MNQEQLQLEFLESEISTTNRKLTYCPTRRFKMKRVGEIVINQDIAFTGGTVWDASVVCGHFLDSLSPRFLLNKHVLELGAGTSIPSIVAARLGATVTCTDLSATIPLTRKCVAENCVELESKPVVIPLEWGTEPEGLNPCTVDIIIGCDIIYDPAHFDPLLKTLQKLAIEDPIYYKSPFPVVYISLEQRRRSVEPFFDQVKAMGFAIQCVQTPMLQAAEKQADILLYEMKFCNAGN